MSAHTVIRVATLFCLFGEVGFTQKISEPAPGRAEYEAENHAHYGSMYGIFPNVYPPEV